MRYASLTCLLILGSFSLEQVAWAQAGGGSVAGVVRDESGAVLPGVTVEAASPALIEQVRSDVTDGLGQYRIAAVPPGTYTVTFTLPGFQSVRNEGLRLNTGFTATLNAELNVGDFEETITVSGVSPVVDSQNVHSQSVLTREVMDMIPGGRTLAGMARMTLGMTGGSNDVGGTLGDVSSFGLRGTAGVGEIHNTGQGDLTVDGVRMTANYGKGNSLRNSLNQQTFEEVVLQLGGMSAESESGGLSVNMITKSGSNEWSGVFNGEYANSGMQASNLSERLTQRGLSVSPQLKRLFDEGGGIGGPIKRDSLWFYASHRYWAAITDYPGLFFNATQGTLLYTPDPDRPVFRDQWNLNHDVKFTWRATDKLVSTLHLATSNTCICPNGSSSARRAGEASIERRFWPMYTVHGSVSAPVTSRFLIDASVSVRRENKENRRVAEVGPADRPVLELSTGFNYGSRLGGRSWAGDYGVFGFSTNVTARAAVTYVRAGHALKVGFSSWMGNNPIGGEANFYEQYRFRNGIPDSIRQEAGPNFYDSRVDRNLGVFAQDQWTVRRATLTLGVRYDNLVGSNPEQTRPAGPYLPELHFLEQRNLPNWKDINPRLGVSYDVFGDAKTAIKASLGRYVVLDAVSFAVANNPSLTLQTSTTRTWDDELFGAGDPRSGDFVPDCDLRNPGANGECGPMNNRAFGTSVITRRFAEELRTGWGVRPYNWQASLQLEHELRPNVALKVGYYRTSYGNFTVEDNLAISSSDFSEFCITTPSDARLPGGGGQPLCGLYDIAPNKFGETSDRLVRPASDFGEQTNIFHGLDAGVTARFVNGVLLTTGASFGKIFTDDCAVRPDSPDTLFCEQSNTLIQYKLGMNYPLPWWDVHLSGVLINVNGTPLAASYVATNTEIAQTLGRNLGRCGTAAVCNATHVVSNIMEPNTLREPRRTQADFRVSKVVQLPRDVRVRLNADVYNLFNADTILGFNTRFGRSWLNASTVLSGRLFKLGVQLDF